MAPCAFVTVRTTDHSHWAVQETITALTYTNRKTHPFSRLNKGPLEESYFMKI